jgi:pyruvate dehydrogenase E1 component
LLKGTWLVSESGLAAVGAPASDLDLATLAEVESRVLWLATSIVHHANRVRTTRSEIKVGGHQASSASVVSIMTALYLQHLKAADRVSVKPHASPVLHAINYLLGKLERSYLTELRAFGGLQSYPSRLKDPDPADFSTGSVGIGATSTVWSAVAKRYVDTHFATPSGGRHIAILGDAELDEGACWEAIVDPTVPRLGELLWIVDLNRQSLDRVVPEIATGRIAAMFAAAGWHTITVKYGRRLGRLFAEPGGEALRARIDEMPNEEYQSLLRASPADLRDALPGRFGQPLGKLVGALSDEELRAAMRDLGGHDLGALVQAYRDADAVTDRPTVVFAYTIKAWRLATEGHPGNHSALLSDAQWRELAVTLGADADDPWRTFEPGSRAAMFCADASRCLERPVPELRPVPPIPTEMGRKHQARASTQQAFGRFFLDLHRAAPDVAERVVTVSPDVASSTNLGGWINKSGVWSVTDRPDWFEGDPDRLLRWSEGTRGQHIELGIAEGNLVGLLGELGLTWSRDGQPLLPIGTLYDPFVNRALEPWSFGLYAGSQSILVGTPSGVTLAPEGGAHQSIITPSVGLEQPGCIAWEPCFGQDLEWTLLHALSLLGQPNGTGSYFRLSTRSIDQSSATVPADPAARERRRNQVLRGGYVIRSAPSKPRVRLLGMGAVLPEVLKAADELALAGVPVDVACLTSADLVFRALQSHGSRPGDPAPPILDELFPPERAAPMVTVLDGHPHTLSFLGSLQGVPLRSLGVNDFGQSGDIEDLYEYFGIDVGSIVSAAQELID